VLRLFEETPGELTGNTKDAWLNMPL
jgi:hypothetical protein